MLYVVVFIVWKFLIQKKITEWWDDDNTAVCPHCGIDSIIGGSSGVRITEMFLSEMHKRWF